MRRSVVSCALVAGLLACADARACGGFFCMQDPMDQAGEQIVFAASGSQVTAHIRIDYQGTAQDFAWILPLPAEPEPPEVGTEQLFSELRSRLAPEFRLRRHFENACLGEGEGESEAEAEAEGEPAPPVLVSFQGAVGPFELAVVSSDDPEALVAWLSTRRYDIPAESTDLIAHYVELDHWFVAIKLQSNRDVGDLQPIVVRFTYDRPCVPLILTAIAAVDDMDVRLWVLGDARAIPINYRHVLIDEAKIDWLCGGSNYQQVVTEAANESGGRAFVTEYAGTSDVMRGALYWGTRFHLAALTASLHPAAFILEIGQQDFPRDDVLLAILTSHIPPPAGQDGTDFINTVFGDCACTSPSECTCLDATLAEYLDGLTFDAAAAAAELDQRIIQPLEAAQDMFDDNPYLTQMFTTISPGEMTLDPMFSFNADLPKVSNVHEANLYYECQDGLSFRRLVLADGREIWFHPDDDDCTDPDPEAEIGTLARLTAELPGSELSEDLPESTGLGRIAHSNTADIDRILGEHNLAVGRRISGAQPPGDKGCSCDLRRAPPASLAEIVVCFGLALLLWGRRRGD